MIFEAQKTANQWKEELKERVDNFKSKPVMAVIVAKDYYPPSKIYINNKIKTNKDINAETKIFEIEWEGRDGVDVYTELRELVDELNENSSVNGIIIQRPFLDFTEKELDIVAPVKDIDGLGVIQQGLLINKSVESYIPATAYGVVKSIQSQFGNDLSGLTISIINRSPLIGIPLQTALRNLNATVVNLHTKSDKEFTQYMLKNSNIIVTATGRRAVYCSKDFSDKVKMIIDCSMDKDKTGMISGVGDIFQDEVLRSMPECVLSSNYNQTGKMTCAALSANLVRAYEIQNNLRGEVIC